MRRLINRQIALKPQDLVVLLKVALWKGRSYTYARLSQDLAMSASQVHASLQRAQVARLVASSESDGLVPILAALREFVLYGAQYAFPGVTGSITRGTPTAYAGPTLRMSLTQNQEAPPVWPHASGVARGFALYPLYPGVPIAAELDPALYDML